MGIKKNILAVIAMGAAFSVSAANTADSERVFSPEEFQQEATRALIDGLVELQLDSACHVYINNDGNTFMDVTPKCTANIHKLKLALESSGEEKYIKRVDEFMKRNNIPKI